MDVTRHGAHGFQRSHLSLPALQGFLGILERQVGDAKAWHWHSREGGGHRELPGAFLDPTLGSPWLPPPKPPQQRAARGVPRTFSPTEPGAVTPSETPVQ